MSKILIALVLGSLIWLIAFFANYMQPYMAIFYPVFILFSGFLVISYANLLKFYSTCKMESEIIHVMSQIVEYKTKNSRLPKILSFALQMSNSKIIREKLKLLISRIRLGDTFANSFTYLFSGEMKSHCITFNDTQTYSKISNFLILHEEKKKATNAILVDSLQRLSTINLFLSTLFPSFLLFSFVGISIVSQAPPSMLIASITILLIIPGIYSISFGAFARRLIVQTL